MDLKDFAAGTVALTKKPHACGGDRWLIVRTGADIRLKCLVCGREIFLPPDELKKRTRRLEAVR